MIVVALLLSLPLVDPEPPRAELCLAHVEAMIAEAGRETGRVAGPSWFIRSWWTAQLPEGDAPEAWSAERRERLALSMPERKAADPDAYTAELQSCVDEAIEGGALP
ncbi:hypothetical protein [Brevundimonas sp.]|uniref:hypothetical protein n=1 Tax=Brevundimonas sp. TaxID=1871086 RepID=UPI002D5436FC|nr:hypothetical protein [Brevundimonas sp.]HYD27561.1 hypothetical protein [Brevundimonas sp.]